MGVYLLCVHPDAVETLLYKLHEGVCGIHTGGCSLAHKMMRLGYWWSNMQRNAQEYAKKNVIYAKDMCLIFTSQEDPSTICLARGLLINGD